MIIFFQMTIHVVVFSQETCDVPNIANGEFTGACTDVERVFVDTVCSVDCDLGYKVEGTEGDVSYSSTCTNVDRSFSDVVDCESKFLSIYFRLIFSYIKMLSTIKI